jgi:hypothetical protein
VQPDGAPRTTSAVEPQRHGGLDAGMHSAGQSGLRRRLGLPAAGRLAINGPNFLEFTAFSFAAHVVEVRVALAGSAKLEPGKSPAQMASTR